MGRSPGFDFGIRSGFLSSGFRNCDFLNFE
jgi:hypothetical protein